MNCKAEKILCAVSYWFASDELYDNVENELKVTVEKEAMQLNDRLETKKAFGESISNVLTSLNGNMNLLKTKEILGTVTSDKEILEMTVGLDDKYCYCCYAGNITGKLDPTTRSWFQNARDFDNVNTNAYIVSIGVPVKADGNILATAKFGAPAKNFKEINGIGDHFNEMVKQGNGCFEMTIDDEEMIFAYSTLPETGWLIGIIVPVAEVFAPFKNMRLLFAALNDCSFYVLHRENHKARHAALTASSQQSAEASAHVAEIVSEVSSAVTKQMCDIDSAKENGDTVFTNIKAVEEKSRIVSDTSDKIAQAAQKGSELMKIAVESMNRIERSVMASAQVVRKHPLNGQRHSSADERN